LLIFVLESDKNVVTGDELDGLRKDSNNYRGQFIKIDREAIAQKDCIFLRVK